MSASIFSKCCCALSASLQSFSNLLLHCDKQKDRQKPHNHRHDIISIARKETVYKVWISCVRWIAWPLISTIMDVTTCMDASYTFQTQYCVWQRSVYVIDTATGSVKVCRLQIKQMFIVAICVQKNNYSSDPLSAALTEQSVFVVRVCTLNYAYLPHTHNGIIERTESWRGQGSYASLSCALFLSPVKGARQR